MSESHLVELAVTDLGIIERIRLVFGPGMTALTGETGAGKTLIVGALDLLLGGRADPGMVRAGCAEAVVEGRFEVDGEELILTRVVPVEGRSRAYVNGHMATAGSLAETADELVDLHGQHAHQSLLAAAVQRAALDQFGAVDVHPLVDARAERTSLEAELAALGGDEGARAREADLLRFQVAELESAGLADPAEDEALDEAESVLADALAHREGGAAAVAALSADDGAIDGVGAATQAIDGRGPYSELSERLHAAQAELGDIAAALRDVSERIEEDPERLAAIRERRQLLVDLRRKYADGQTLADVISYGDEARRRLDEIEHHDERATQLDSAIAEAAAAEAKAAAAVGAARRQAAGPLATAVEAHLADLAMPSARFEVSVDDVDPGDHVTFLLAANPGSNVGPLAKVASGGELARTMLALRLVLSVAPPVLVFDEVDAGIGGQAALEVGRALAALGRDHQVLVVTHLPQVAAFADAQVSIRKQAHGDVTVASATPLDEGERVIELSRMLSGTPESTTVQGAANELLSMAAAERAGDR